jgi:hypothetical protein
MGLLSRAGDLVYTFRFLRLLTTKFEDTTAYELGIIDDKAIELKQNLLLQAKRNLPLHHSIG